MLLFGVKLQVNSFIVSLYETSENRENLMHFWKFCCCWTCLFIRNWNR